MVQYLEPLQLVRESTKKPGTVFLGLSFRVEYVSLAIYDHGYLTSPFYCKCPRDETLLDYLLGYVQSLQKDFEYRLEGINVANSSSVVPRKIIHNLIDDLCKKGKFETLNYTCWEHNLTYSATQTFYSAQHMLQTFLHHYNTLLCYKGDEREDSKREEMVQYLELLQLFRECMKRNYHMPSSVFLGLSFDDNYVSSAMSDDCYLTARFYKLFPRNDSLSDKLVDFIQMLNEDFEYDLEGIIVAYSSSTAPPEKICNLMEGLCQKGKLASLKYTFWEDDIASEGVEFECNEFGSLFWGITTEIQHACEKMFSAQNMLDKRCKICHSGAEHKMVQYLEPWQLFRESMKMTFYMLPAVFLGLSISDKIVSLAMSDSLYSNACHYGIYPIDDKNLFDKLLDSVLRLKIDSQYDLLGIVVANRSSKENPLSLEIDDLMDHLCKKARLKSLKYTRWEDNIASLSSLFDIYGSGWKAFPVDGSKLSSELQEELEVSSA